MEKEIEEKPILFIEVEENPGNKDIPYKLKVNPEILEITEKFKDRLVKPHHNNPSFR